MFIPSQDSRILDLVQEIEHKATGGCMMVDFCSG